MIVALTGGIGCGKTTVLNEFRKLGIPCFVADEVAGGYYQHADFLEQVRGLFGPSVIAPDGKADKRAIANIVFNDKHALRQLEELIHPRVLEDLQRFAQEHSDAPYVIFESAILYESGFDRVANKVVCVYLGMEERIERLKVRDGATREQLLERMNNQCDADETMMKADYVVLNYEGNPRSRQVAHIHARLVADRETPIADRETL